VSGEANGVVGQDILGLRKRLCREAPRRAGLETWLTMRTMPEQHDTKLFRKVTALNPGLAKAGWAELTLLQAILDNAPAVVYLKDAQGRYVMVNKRYEELFHLKRAEVWGKTDYDIFPQHIADAFQANDRQVLEQQRPQEFEEIAGQHAEFRTYISVKFPLHDEHGVPMAICGISTDITERKQAEEQMARLAAIVESCEDAICSVDLEGIILSWNAGARRVFGYESQEIVGWGMDRLLPPDRLEEEATMLAKVRRGESVKPFETVRLNKSGRRIDVSVTVSPIRDHQGRVVGASKIARDISERKENEERLRRAYEELAQNDEILRQTLRDLEASHEELKRTQLELIQAAKLESVGTLAAGVAHEVKNPLQTILMGLAFLSSNLPADNRDVTETLGRMRDAVKRANSIISELLQLSSATELTLAEEDFQDLLERALELMRYELNASLIIVERHYEAPVRRVQVDRTKMEQVLINIFLNAIQAMSQNGVLTVRTRSGKLGEGFPLGEHLYSEFQPGDTLVVAEIQDAGCGIPEAFRSKIFDPFFTTKPVGIGTGLGLSVMKKIIDLHGGAMDIRNHPDGGVVVTLVLKGYEGGVL
jgi:PAS domain S-box-containing protein